VDHLFQAVGEDTVKFVVDRRPSKTLLADILLRNVSETATADSTAEMDHKEDDDDGCDVEPDDKQQKRSKKRRHSYIHDGAMKFSVEEMKISPTIMSDLDTGSKLDLTPTGNVKMKRKKKGEQNEYLKNVSAEVGEDSNHEPVIQARRERKKHKYLIEENTKTTEVEKDDRNESDNSVVISQSNLPSSVDVPRHGRKKYAKNRHETSVDAAEGAVNNPTAGTAGKDLGIEPVGASVKTGSAVSDIEFVHSPSGMSQGETIGVKQPSQVHNAELPVFELVMQDNDDDAGKAASGSKVSGSLPSLPSHGKSKKVIKSPSSGYKATLASEEAVVDSPVMKGHSPLSSLDPAVISDSVVAKKSPKKTSPNRSQVLPSSSDVSAARPLTETPTSVPVCYLL